MKTSFSFLCFLFFFSFFGHGQVVDSAAVTREVDSLIKVSNALTDKRNFGQALEVSKAAEKVVLEKLGRETATYGNICANRGRVLYFKRDYSEAEKWLLEALAIREKILGRQHADYATSITGLANLYRATNRLAKAEPLYEQALVIRRNVFGKENIEYARGLNNLALIYTDLNEYEKAEPLYLESKAVREKIVGKEHSDYVVSLQNLARLYIAMVKYEQAESLYSEICGIRAKLLGKEHPDYAASLNDRAVVFWKMGKYEQAKPLYLESKAIREKALGKEHPDYISSLNNLAILYWEMGNFEEAEQLFFEVKDILEKKLGKEHPDYANSLNSLATLYWKKGNYEKAEALLLESITILEKTLGKGHPDYSNCLNNLAILYSGMGNYEKAEPLIFEAKAIREKKLGKEHPDYANSLISLANLYKDMGDYEKAEPLHLEAKAILEKTLGKEHLDYATSLNNLAILYVDMGNYQKAEPLYLEAKAIWEKKLGKEHPDYAHSLNNLAILYSRMGKQEKIEPLYLESRAIWEKSLGREHYLFANSLNNLANLYWRMGNYERAEPLYLEAKVIREKVFGKKHPEYARSLNNLANLYLKMGNYEKAEPLFLETQAILEIALGKEHPDFAQSLSNLATLYWATGDFDIAGSYLLEAGAIEKPLLIKAIRHLSERELASYIAKFTNKLNRNFSFDQTQTGISDASYDNILFHKGFLLNANLRINHLTLSDPAAAENYNRLKTCHRRLAAEYAKPTAERKNVAELEEKANTLEKELTRSVAGFGEALRQVNWQEVQAALKPGEAAIEFIRFHYHNPYQTDSTLYAALLLLPARASLPAGAWQAGAKAGSDPNPNSPAFIPLFEEKQLDALLAPLAGQGSGGLNELYGGKAGQSLYRLLWSPIEPHLTDVKTVYYSPSGLMHRLNVGALAVAEGTILADRHELVCLSSTRQLVAAPASVTATATATALVYGGIKFDMDSTSYSARRNLQNDDGNRGGLSFAQSDSTFREDVWQYLKWSEKEADNVQNILAKAGIAAEARKGWQATEESFKQIGRPLQGDKKPSPRLLHISTHGFFFPDPSPSQGKEKRDTPPLGGDEPVFKISDHPMIRSGLVFAGANHAWKTGKPLGNREDGILTAYEISQLDLRNTDLVVLSACETGLGQIEGNEGVYGLQRAFKIAGAKYLVMSLWQVPDYQTQELMTVFYRNMLEGKMPVRQALHAAQNEMRKKRYEPFYWAGFVLLE